MGIPAYPGATPAWSNRAGVQAFVVWQDAQSELLGMWFVPLPRALVPSWQVTQAPVTCV